MNAEDPLESLLNKLLLIGWVKGTGEIDMKAGQSKAAIVYTDEGLGKLRISPVPVLISEIESKSGPLREAEKAIVPGLVMLAKNSARISQDQDFHRRQGSHGP